MTVGMKHLNAVGLMGLLLVGCSTAPKTSADRVTLQEESRTALRRAITMDPTLQAFLDKSAAYVVFPSVGKGGLIVGGSYGRGIAYQNGVQIGYADITQATVGAQVGGQTYTEILAIEDAATLARFKTGKVSLSANASAVALKSGAAAASTAGYKEGLVVFVQPTGGLMAEATIGGQQFTFQEQ